MSTISAGTTSTTAFKVTSDTTGTLVLQTGAVPTTALSISASGVVTFPATTTIGTLYFGAGTVTAPSISTTGDSNTGIYFPAADTIAFTEGGVESARFDSSGNFGIGTSSPTFKLDVASSGGSLFRLVRGTVSYGAFLGATEAFVGTFSNNNLLFITNDTTKATLDTSGNLGLGVTPSAWGSSWRASQVGPTGGAAFNFTSNRTFGFTNNGYNDNTNWKYVSTGFSTLYVLGNDGSHAWSTAASGTAGNNITFTQAMTLDSGGRLLLGRITSDANNYRIQISQGTATYGSGIQLVYEGAGAAAIWENSSGALCFGNDAADGDTERARITSGGNLLVGTTNNAARLVVATNNAGGRTAQIYNESPNTSSSVLELNTAYTGNTTGWFLRGGDATVYQFYIYSNGNIVNSNGSYGTLSDAKMKTDIVDAGSQWADIKAIRFRKFKMKDDPTGLMQLGVVAQELEQTSPGLVDEHPDRDAKNNDLGTTTKSVKTSVLLMKAAVALQEAMGRIEKLESEMAALKGLN